MIPIRNLYYIFCYAWASFPAGDATEVGDEECPDLQNLFAKLLIDGLHRLIRRGLDRGYVMRIEDSRSPRGRILLDEMIKRQTLRRGEAVCQFDELQFDVLHNQILKATARSLAKSENLLPAYRHELGILAKRLEAVSDIRLSSECFRRVQISRSNRQYGMLMRLCEFVFHSALPEEGGTGSRFADILNDEVRMSAVFEEFLRNFYAHEQNGFAVKRDILNWDATALTAGSEALVPNMETDITLRSTDRTIVIDAKYYKDPLVSRRGSPPKLRSPNLYQLFTYLHHASLKEPDKHVDGMLIFPTVETAVCADYRISGHGVRIATIDLNRPWPEIHDELLQVIARPFAEYSAPNGAEHEPGALVQSH